MAKSKKKGKNQKSQKPNIQKNHNSTEPLNKGPISNPKIALTYKDKNKEVKIASEIPNTKTETEKITKISLKKEMAEAAEKTENQPEPKAEEPVKNIKAPVKKKKEEPAKKIKTSKQKIKVIADILITEGDYTEILETDEDSAEKNERGVFSRFFRQVK